MSRYIPSLDGLRAVSIVMVIALHSVQRISLQHPMPKIAYVLMNGALGVKIFFVISGYLITRLLLREYEQSGTISLNRFYVRRAFRILPPLYLYVGFLALLTYLGKLHLTWRLALGSMLFFHNYDPRADFWALEHTWSLCVEEQFYLLWPAVLVWVLLRYKGPSVKEVASRILLAGIVLCAVVRFASLLSPWTYLHNTSMFQNSCDAILFGCLAAMSEGTSWAERIYSRIMRYPWLTIFVLYIVFGYLESYLMNRWNCTIGNTLQALLITCVLVWAVREPQTAFGRSLNLAPVRWIGTISYSLYLWQTLFLHHRNVEVFGHTAFQHSLPASWLMILCAAVASYYLVERPVLVLRNVLVRRFSPV